MNRTRNRLVREAAATTVYITHDQAEAFALADQVGVLENGRLAQQGTPEEIYTEPATPFVARFTGLAGELSARIKDRHADSTVLVEPDDGIPFLARSRSAVSSASDGVIVLVRPAGVHLCPADGNGGGENGHHLTGRVTDVAFRGRGYEHAIELADHTRLTGVVAEYKVPRGDPVAVRLDPAACHAFPRLPRLPRHVAAAPAVTRRPHPVAATAPHPVAAAMTVPPGHQHGTSLLRGRKLCCEQVFLPRCT
jgi:iron(III) transport system ATP-binding protein